VALHFVLHGSCISEGLSRTRDALHDAVAAAKSDLQLSVDLVGFPLGHESEHGQQVELGLAMASPEWKAASHTVLFNNAGLTGRMGAKVGELTYAEFAEPLKVNAIAMGRVAGVYLTNTHGKASRVVVHTSSIAATKAIETWAPYCASKAASRAIHECIAAEYKDVRVLQFSPGPLATDMTGMMATRGAPGFCEARALASLC
jgi:NAD(P)-dependent dehydrogenase (short-subunit alcohol dehydrogenase family)